RSQKSEVRSQKQKSEVRSQRSEVRSHRSEVRAQDFHFSDTRASLKNVQYEGTKEVIARGCHDSSDCSFDHIVFALGSDVDVSTNLRTRHSSEARRRKSPNFFSVWKWNAGRPRHIRT